MKKYAHKPELFEGCPEEFNLLVTPDGKGMQRKADIINATQVMWKPVTLSLQGGVKSLYDPWWGLDPLTEEYDLHRLKIEHKHLNFDGDWLERATTDSEWAKVWHNNHVSRIVMVPMSVGNTYTEEHPKYYTYNEGTTLFERVDCWKGFESFVFDLFHVTEI